jgi:hypothetical protein
MEQMIKYSPRLIISAEFHITNLFLSHGLADPEYWDELVQRTVKLSIGRDCVHFFSEYTREVNDNARICLVKREKGPSPSLVMRNHVKNVESGGFHYQDRKFVRTGTVVCRLLAEHVVQSCRLTSCVTHARRNKLTVTVLVRIVFTSWEGNNC